MLILQHHNGILWIFRRVKARKPVIHLFAFVFSFCIAAGLGCAGFSGGSFVLRGGLGPDAVGDHARQHFLQAFGGFFAHSAVPAGHLLHRFHCTVFPGDPFYKAGFYIHPAVGNGVHHARHLQRRCHQLPLPKAQAGQLAAVVQRILCGQHPCAALPTGRNAGFAAKAQCLGHG